MSSLAETQRRFLADLYGESALAPRAAVYRRNVFANLHDALAAAYPVVLRLVGDAFFREAATHFTRAHPSTRGDLHAFGSQLADFLARYAPARDLGYLPDVARLEWVVAQAFHAADPRRLDLDALASVGEEDRSRMRFYMQDAARLIESQHPIVAIWQANQPARDGAPEAIGPQRALVYREGTSVRVCALGAVPWCFLERVASGATLGAMAEDAVLGNHVAAELPRWTHCGVIDAFALLPPR
jgi:Putative DNA-binding domain